jgi:DNA repair photolyase
MPVRPLSNPPNPWASTSLEWLGPPPAAQTRVYLETARSLIVANDSPDVPFRFSANAYRGCAHACAYCYARPTHEFLGFGAGTDFESQLVVKENAAELLEAELAAGRTGGEPLVLSGVTDPYQPLEASFGLTRRLLEVCLAAGQPLSILTKGALVRRDIELLAQLARGPGLRVYLTLISLDEDLARALEPGAPTPSLRLRALAELSAAGVPTGVSLSPLIPGLNDQEGPALLEAAARAGARRAFRTLLRLPGSVEAVFVERLQARLPGRARKVLSALREARGGQLGETRFHARMTGVGPRFQAAEALFRLTARRLGIELGEEAGPALPAQRRPAQPAPVRRGAPPARPAPGQGLLFEP